MIQPKYRAFAYFALTMGYSIGYSLMAPTTFFFVTGVGFKERRTWWELSLYLISGKSELLQLQGKSKKLYFKGVNAT